MDENCIVRDETIDTTDGYDDGSDDGDCDEPGTRTSSDDSAMKDVESSAKKKRKRKKKKKNKGASPGSSGGDAQNNADAALRRAAHGKLAEEISSLSRNDEDNLWVKLSDLYIDDEQMKKICAALQKNTTVLSLDLSHNLITDAGVLHLCKALQEGAAPDLIELKMHDNIGVNDVGLEALKDLQSVRKTIRVEMQAQVVEVPATAGDRHSIGNQGSEDAQESRDSSKVDKLQQSSLVQRLFQVGGPEFGKEAEDVDDGGLQNENYMEMSEQNVEPEELSKLLWNEVFEAAEEEVPVLSRISEPLRAIADAVAAEMDSCMLPMLEDTQFEDFKPFTRDAASHLSHCRRFLDFPATREVTQFSKDKAVARAGSHRIALAEVVSHLMRAECPVMLDIIREADLLPHLFALGLARPTCSALHVSLLRLLHHALSPVSGHARVWDCIFSPLECDISVPCRGFERNSGGGGNNSCIAQEIFDIVISSENLAVGLRPPHVGFAIAVADLLCSAAMGEPVGPSISTPHEMQATFESAEGDAPANDGRDRDTGCDVRCGEETQRDVVEANESTQDGESTAAKCSCIGEKAATTSSLEDSRDQTDATALVEKLSNGSFSPANAPPSEGANDEITQSPSERESDVSGIQSQTSLQPWQLELRGALGPLGGFSLICQEDGPLAELLSCQRQELGGPRPCREPLLGHVDSDMAGLFNGGMMMMGSENGMVSGSDLLALLQNLGMSGSK